MCTFFALYIESISVDSYIRTVNIESHTKAHSFVENYIKHFVCEWRLFLWPVTTERESEKELKRYIRRAGPARRVGMKEGTLKRVKGGWADTQKDKR